MSEGIAWIKYLTSASISCAASVLLQGSLHAAIIGGTSTVRPRGGSETTLPVSILNPPPSLISGNTFEGESVFAFDEKQNVILPRDIQLYDGFHFSNPRPTADFTIPQGTSVSSHFIFIDAPGQAFLTGTPRYFWSGEITFSQPILGILPMDRVITPRISDTHDIFGLDETVYAREGRGLDNLHDVVTFSRNTLTFDFSAGDGMDMLRVVTYGEPQASVPEPLTILGSGFAAAFGVYLKRKVK